MLVMAALGEPERNRRLNDEALTLQRTDERAFALCSVHPYDPGALEDLDALAARGAHGIKLHPNTQAFDVGDPRVAAVVDRAGNLGLPVLFDSISVTDPAQPDKFLLLAAQHPHAKIVLAHAFGPKFPQLLMFDILTRQLGGIRNVWFELSGILPLFADSPFADQLLWVLRRLGLDRTLWGSDYPLYDPSESFAALRHLGLSDDETAQVAHRTARELYLT